MLGVTVRILSLGAGVQSTTLLLMAVEGEISIDAAIFADTGWEPRAVYEHLSHIETLAALAGIAVHRVSGGDLRADALAGKPEAWLPLHVRGGGKPQGQLRRQCTSHYKIMPIKRQLRDMGFGPKNPVTVVKGISYDEFQRMRDSDVKYIRHEYPLVDMRMTRGDCLLWLQGHGYPEPAKSACIGCPFHNTAGWQGVKANPIEWADAVDFDKRMRTFRKDGAETFLHWSGVPLEDVDLKDAHDAGQLDLFTAECAGVCAV